MPQPKIRMVSTGSWHACAVTGEGDAYCWGDNSSGQLGDGTSTDSPWPVRVRGLPAKVVNVAAGNAATCASLVTGAVACWGSNDAGVLGAPETVRASTRPRLVKGLESGWTGVGVGWNSACARTAQGQVKCWGSNAWGQLGNGSDMRQSATPVQVKGLESGVRRIGVGLSHACAVTDRQRAVCWGNNGSGQLGDGTTRNAHTPVAVAGVPPVRVLSARARTSCAATENGQAWCWGDNGAGQVGPEATEAVVARPTRVGGLAGSVGGVTTGHGTSCAAVDQALWCWGAGERGGLAGGTLKDSRMPLASLVLTDGVTQLASGDVFACAVRAEGVYCWGDNARGSLGSGRVGGISAQPTRVAL